MTAEIIAFPVKKPLNTSTIDDPLPEDWPYVIDGVKVKPPKSGRDYLDLCKQYLPDPEDYLYILGAIMDRDVYYGLESQFQNLVDNYWYYRTLEEYK